MDAVDAKISPEKAKPNDARPATPFTHFDLSRAKNTEDQLSITSKDASMNIGASLTMTNQKMMNSIRHAKKITQTKLANDDAINVTSMQCTNLKTPPPNVTVTNKMNLKRKMFQKSPIKKKNFSMTKRNLFQDVCQEEVIHLHSSDEESNRSESTATVCDGVASDDDETYNLKVYFPDKISSHYTNFRSCQFQLKRALEDHMIFNELKFQHVLKHNVSFAEIVTRMPSNQLEHVKKQMYQVIRQRMTHKTYAERIQDVENYSFHNNDFVVALGTFIEIINSIAAENNTIMQDFLTDCFKIINMILPKRNTLVFIGKSNSGKSILCDVLLSVYETYELGFFNLPPSRNTDQFWLEPLIGAAIYRAEEVFVANEDHIVKLKQLFEGNPALVTPIKYKNPIIVPRRPVIVSMNGEGENDLTRGISRERETMKNRSFIYKMNKNLRERYTDGSESLMKQYSKQICKFCYERFGRWRPEAPAEKLVDYYTDLIEPFI